jgi:hypothetical protein
VRLDDPGLTSIKSPNVGNAPTLGASNHYSFNFIIMKKNKTPQLEIKKGMTKNERLSIIIASLALLVSLTQLLLSIPFIINKIYRPEIKVKVHPSILKKDKYLFLFEIVNSGNKSADGLITTFLCYKNDSVNYSPRSGYEIGFKASQNNLLKEVDLKAGHFLPGAEITVSIFCDTTNINNFTSLMGFSKNTTMKEIAPPYVDEIKYNDGFGTVEQ